MAGNAQRKDQTEALLKLVSLGNEEAAARLLNLHRRRLRRMVDLRINEDLAALQDPSDVVQETILAAAHRLPDYAQKPDIPFYAWLRRLAWNRLVELHRQNLDDPDKADFRQGQLNSKCLSEMVKRFGPDPEIATKGAGEGSSISRRLARKRVELSLSKLDPSARELLVLYYVEQLTVPEIACALKIGDSQVKLLHVKAIRRLQTQLEKSVPDSSS